ncbi:MAG TPA: hypothetical protein PLV83_01215 [Bacilli bacterium]|nr:hypothetical protein [Bacilli bacterium]
MNENKKTNNVIKYIFLIIFMTYTAIFVMVNMGYYEYSNYTKKVFTEEQIKKFENDIKSGIELDINNYLVDEKEVFSKKQIGSKISEFIGNCSKTGIEKIFKLLNKVIET